MRPETHRFDVRVKPGSKRPSVGGTWGDEALVVAVAARAVEGKANKAVVDALAGELQIQRSRLTIVRGLKSRSKTLELTQPTSAILEHLDELRRS